MHALHSPASLGTTMHDDAPPTDLRAALDALLEDPDLARLDAARAPFDPLAVLGWSGRERAHTRLLGWLVDPAARSPERAHGFGDGPLRALVSMALELGNDPAAPQGFHRVRVWREEPLGDGLGDTARAPDLRCEWVDDAGAPWVLVLEDKLDAAEGDAQVRDYLGWIRRARPGHRALLVYLTPDGRPPTSVTAAPELRVARWGDLAARILGAVETCAPGDARDFAAACLRAMVSRFEASPEVRALVAALYARHPHATEVAAAAGGDPAARQRVAARFPTAAWRLRTHGPREATLTERWAAMVADAFQRVAPQGVRLRVGAPHARCADRASWSLDGVTDRLALHVMAWPGHLLGRARPRLWVALHAPNRDATAVFAEREQTAAVASLPAATRAWLGGATPVTEPGGAWRWLRVGDELPLPQGFDDVDRARRTAEAIAALVGEHLGALAAAFASPAHRLYSADLDDDHLLPVDVRDREALHAEARPEARHVVILAPEAGGDALRLRAATDLGATLAAAYGGTGALSYDYDGGFALGLPSRGRPVVAVPLASVGEGDASRCAARLAGLDGDVVLYGRAEDLERARGALRPLVAACTGPSPHATGGEVAVRWEGVTSAIRDARGLGAPWTFRAGEGVAVVASAEVDGRSHPLVATWRVGVTRVVLLAADLAPLRARPELFARWFRALLGAAEVALPAGPVVTPAVTPAVTPTGPLVMPATPLARPAPRRVLAPAVRRRSVTQTHLPGFAPAVLPQAAFAPKVVPSVPVLADLDEVVVVDTETTGLSSTARLVEIGALHLRGGAVVGRFQTLVDPEEPIPRSVIRVHGITDAMVRGAPTARDAIRDWLRFVGSRPVVAHNASFDLRIFAQELTRVGLPKPGVAFWCTKRFAKAAFPAAPGYGLAALQQWLGLPSPPAHRALADCLTAAALLGACRARATDAALTARHGPPKPL